MLITKIYIISIIILNLIIKEVHTQASCSEKCELCESGICLKCYEGFIYQKDKRQCISQCDFGRYYNNQSKDCVSICPYQYYNDNSFGSCEQLPKCPTLIEQGNQYFNLFQNYILVQDKIYVSGTSNQVDNSIKIFENKDFEILGSLEGHQSEVFSINFFTSKQLMDAKAVKFKGESDYSDSLISLSSNEIIEWDKKYGKIKKRTELIIDFKIPTSSKQMLYFDEKSIILNKNLTHFGILDYRSMQNEPNQINQKDYLKVFPVVHLNTILGYFQGKGDSLYSYSTASLIKWDISNLNYERLCTFKDKIKQMLIISKEKQIILFENAQTLFYVFNDKCLTLLQLQNDFIMQINLVDSAFSQIIILTQKQLSLYTLDVDQSFTSELIGIEISNILLKDKIAFMNVFDLQELNSKNELVIKKNLILVNVDGLFKIYEILQSKEYSETQKDKWFLKILEIDIQFKYQPQINHVIVNKQSQNILLLGNELILTKVDFQKQTILDKTTRKNLKQSFSGHKGKVNGIIADPTNDRILSYGDDGSFILWEEDIDQQSGINRSRLLLQQYHPDCNLSLQPTCGFPVIKSMFVKSDKMITQYKNDTKIYVWNYEYDRITFNQTLYLTDTKLALLNINFNSRILKLTLNNEKEAKVFDVDSLALYKTFKLTDQTKLYYSSYDEILPDKCISLAIQVNNTYLQFSVECGKGLKLIGQQYAGGLFKKCDYHISSFALSCLTNNNFYQLYQPYNLVISLSLNSLSSFSLILNTDGAQHLILYQQNLKASYYVIPYDQSAFTLKSSLTFSVPIDLDATTGFIFELKMLFFFFQNTLLSSIGSQVII